MKTTLILPALNEAESIRQVIQAIPGDLEAEILVVDGGSQDETVSIARSAGARVVVEPRRGYGWACAAGAKEAQGELLVFMDADGADDPRFLEALTSPIQKNTADLVLGSRLLAGSQQVAMPWHQLAGNWLSARLIRRLYGLAISDLSPFRAVTRAGLCSLKMTEMTFGWPTEMIVKAARAGWRVQEIAVVHQPRLGGRSKISGTVRGTILATYHILSTIFKYVRWEGI